MYEFENFLALIDEILNTRRKRHIVGGILVSLSALFGGLAATALSIRPENKENDEDE